MNGAFETGFARALESLLAAPLTDAGRRVYAEDPDLYARERLGVELLPHQQAVAFAVAGRWERITHEMAELAQMRNPGRQKLAVTSCQKAGKSTLLVIIAFWFYECRRVPSHGAKFLLTAAKGDQVRTVIWAELKRVLRQAPHPPPGTPAQDPQKGFKVPGAEECIIIGFTGRNAESVAGQSGNQMIAVDEASALEDDKAKAIAGNRLGGSDLGVPQLWLANPTRPSGPLYDAFHSQREFYTTFHFDGERIARYQSRRPGGPVPYIINQRAVDESKAEYGEQDPFYLVRVRGIFLQGEAGKIVNMTTIAAMQERWKELWSDPDGVPLEGRARAERWRQRAKNVSLGRLRIGYDPASKELGRDEHGFSVVRGPICFECYARAGLTEEQAVAELVVLMARYRSDDDDDVPVLNFDAEGDVGDKMHRRLVREEEERRTSRPAEAFELHAVRSSSRHVREPQKYMHVRDELWKTLALWCDHEDAAIPPDAKLETELYAPMWHPQVKGQTTVTPKEVLRRVIKRSPDRADSLALAVYEAHSIADDVARQLHGGAHREGSQDFHDATTALILDGRGGELGAEDGGGDSSDPFSWAR